MSGPTDLARLMSDVELWADVRRFLRNSGDGEAVDLSRRIDASDDEAARRIDAALLSSDRPAGLRDYAEHRPDCDEEHPTCSCGLDALLDAEYDRAAILSLEGDERKVSDILVRDIHVEFRDEVGE